MSQVSFSLFLFVSVLFLSNMQLSYQQGLVTKGRELFPSAYGRNQSLLTLLYEAPVRTYEITAPAGESLLSMSKKFYGTNQYTSLLIYGNPDIAWNHNINIAQAASKKIKVPYIFDCIQYLGVDCVLHSYNQTNRLSSISEDNYWKQNGGTFYKPNIAGQLTTVMNYSTYMPFIMTHLWNLPETSLTIMIENMLPFDLKEGKLSLQYGRGATPPATIPYGQTTEIQVKQSDIIHGIVGKLTYKRPTFWAVGEHDCEFSFRIHTGNGTLPNYANISFPQFQDGKLTKIHSDMDYVTALKGDQDYGVVYQASITKSPNALLKISLYPSKTAQQLNRGLRRIMSGSLRLEADITNKIAIASTSTTSNKISQNWRLLSTDGWIRYRLLSAKNDSVCLEADPASGQVVLRDTNDGENNQIWTLVATGTTITKFLLKADSGNLCLNVNPTLKYGGVDDYRLIGLEKCSSTEPNQVWDLVDSSLNTLDYNN